MKTIYIIILHGTIFLLLFNGNFSVAKPIFEPLSDDRCSNSDLQDYDRINQNPLGSPDLYKSARSQFQNNDKYTKPLDFNLKRSLLEDGVRNIENDVQKRQVGVVYKEDKPIGILQPYQRSYRFIPVRDEPIQDEPLVNLEKRSLPEVNLASDQYIEESYPSIYTSFKIDSKLEKKRDYDAADDENIRSLKTKIRRLRSAKTRNSNKIEDELKDILDDMGLIQDTSAVEKREVKDRLKREEPFFSDHQLSKASSDANCPSGNNLMSMEQKNQVKTDFNRSPEKKRLASNKERKKRQHVSEEERNDLVEDLKDSGELRLSGNKSPLAVKSEVQRDVDEDEEENSEKRVQRQIQKRINALKEEVKREISALREKKSTDGDEEDDDDLHRKKRHVDSLPEAESDAVNPLKNLDAGELKPLVRKRRSLEYEDDENIENEEEMSKNMERNTRNSEFAEQQKRNSEYKELKKKQHLRENEEAGELLGDDVEDGNVMKRNVYVDEYESVNNNDNERNGRGKRADEINLAYYDDDDDDRGKRSEFDYDQQGKLRIRRRINQDHDLENRPQQLGDMSDADLFGALPKSYNGELSRYKRV